jgi:hypothetical protein
MKRLQTGKVLYLYGRSNGRFNVFPEVLEQFVQKEDTTHLKA